MESLDWEDTSVEIQDAKFDGGNRQRVEWIEDIERLLESEASLASKACGQSYFDQILKGCKFILKCYGLDSGTTASGQ